MANQDSQSDSLVCQQCHQPLHLDPSLSSLTPSQYSLITSALPSPSGPSPLSPTAKLSSLPSSSRQSASIWATANGLEPPNKGVAESFVLLSESAVTPSPALVSPGPVSASHLHALLSSRTPISHPLCLDCAGLLQSELARQREDLAKERDGYIAFERGLSRASRKAEKSTGDKRDEKGLGEYGLEGDDKEWEELMRKKVELQGEETRLIKLLQEKEKVLESVREEEERIKVEKAEMDREEDEFLLSHLSLTRTMTKLTSARGTAKTQHLLASTLLQHLESTNVYNDAFLIGHVPLSGNAGMTVGTINGLRLGGRPVVEWEEINAAWGLVALCLDRIAVKVGCVFEGYKIIPLGSFSRIDALPPSKASFELYGSTDLSLSPARLLHNRRFNLALIAFLDLLKQLLSHGWKLSRSWDKIAGYSIKLPSLTMGMGSMMGFNNDDHSGGEDQWTRACRGVLVVLKRILILESESERG
ncbi:hypothetical protein TREMEDRAFT_66889 [Tremella mesenterica DSM 1558]|uniref:uncharacterized protein n=1 Tax=Tremella mesenterica (strain ATCC 24925 / CBS 8224 / DSM 1558 / NBRC 9311 / NRRL Y-6157 / RJB 2259-6 / UBC 559-6) TaxID=578456 RepID=UPI0003F49031|nr:uncharacterized protein TREMEDRAFT_66889 [Tremella mesenterica DSM 1558]EIW72438.1 hypothetical protein TREMEDRAFT_66889 [Tremella mesenterica DSM 1558]